MAKRSNPFLEDYVQQSKIHVGLKQFNNNEERLSKVYERTLEMLFKGAKRSQPQLPIVADCVPQAKRDNMKQLIINSDGTLTHSDSLIVSNEVESKQCVCGSTSEESHCGYCEVVLCAACLHQCVRCDNSFCARCSLIGSDLHPMAKMEGPLKKLSTHASEMLGSNSNQQQP